MAVYDPEPEKLEEQDQQKKGLSPEEIASREEDIGDSYNQPGGGARYGFDSTFGRHRKTRDASIAADQAEKAAIADKVRGAFGDAQDKDKEGGFFKPEKKRGIRGRLRDAATKRNLLLGGGLAGILVAAGMGIFGFLNTFRIDNILNNIDAKTFSRFNASFDRRSDAWFRSYLKLRMTEWGGDYNNAGGENLYFRSNKVDNDNPIRDWYRTLRTSSFEKDLFEKHGIQFTSIVTPDGRIQNGMIKINNKEIPFDVLNRGDIDFDRLASGNLDQLNRIAPDIDGLIDTQVFENDKAARRAIKNAVNDNTKSYQVFKRRQLRKDIANMTGVREWRLFEKTRDRTDQTRINMQRKIMNKVFAGDANSLRFINCILGGSRCPNTSDVADPDNKLGATPNGTLPDENNTDDRRFDDNGNLIVDDNGNNLNGYDSDPMTRAVSEATADGVQNFEVGDSPTDAVTRNIVSQVAGIAGRSGSIWEWAKRLAAVDALFKSNGEGKSRIVTIVKNARRAQLVAFYATIGISRDQIRSGELIGDEMNDFYAMTKNMGNSEAWTALSSSYRAGTASAQAATNVSREEYCKEGYDRSFDEYAWYCDQYKPNGGSRAGQLEAAYNSSIGYLVGPIAAAVNGINSAPVIGSLLSAFDSITSAITGAIVNTFLSATGLADNVETIIGSVASWLVEFIGGGPFIDPTKPGFAAFALGGSAATAESTTRHSGGIKSTTTSYNYSKQLASEYRQEQLASMSWSERYLSPDNPDSLGASIAMSASDVTVGENVAGKAMTAVAQLPQTLFANMTSFGKASADTDMATLAGVDTYDMPSQCINLDPLDPAYLSKATNAQIPGLTRALLENEDTFWQAVYDNDQPVDREQIFNCAILDKRVRGSLGHLYGYTQDGGYGDPTSQNGTLPNSDATGIVGDPFTSSVDVPCAQGTADLGIHPAFNDGAPVDMRLCAVSNLPSSSETSTPGTTYYIEGANGKGIVNSRVSGAVYSMVAAALADGIQLSASSTFRTKEHQEALWARNPNSTYVAPPGQSNHQTGVAIDFNGTGSIKGGTTCAARARNPGSEVWSWLFSNAERFGYRQYSAESWHWDPSTAASRCDSSQ